MSSTIDLSSVTLTSTLRTAPMNGSISSSDYNSNQRESIVDFTSIVDFINNTLLPLLNALPAGALLPSQSPVGVEGRTINSDTSNLTSLFYDSLNAQPLTISD